MYNGIGLQTPRGSGTNGYIQTNKFFIKPKSGKVSLDHSHGFGADEGTAGLSKKPNTDILEHDKKRQIEVKLLLLEEKLIDQGCTQSHIDEQLSKARLSLQSSAAVASARPDTSCGKRFSETQTHQIAARKEKQLETLRKALGISAGGEDESGQDRFQIEENKTEDRPRVRRPFLDRETGARQVQQEEVPREEDNGKIGKTNSEKKRDNTDGKSRDESSGGRKKTRKPSNRESDDSIDGGRHSKRAKKKQKKADRRHDEEDYDDGKGRRHLSRKDEKRRNYSSGHVAEPSSDSDGAHHKLYMPDITKHTKTQKRHGYDDDRDMSPLKAKEHSRRSRHIKTKEICHGEEENYITQKPKTVDEEEDDDNVGDRVVAHKGIQRGRIPPSGYLLSGEDGWNRWRGRSTRLDDSEDDGGCFHKRHSPDVQARGAKRHDTDGGYRDDDGPHGRRAVNDRRRQRRDDEEEEEGDCFRKRHSPDVPMRGSRQSRRRHDTDREYSDGDGRHGGMEEPRRQRHDSEEEEDDTRRDDSKDEGGCFHKRHGVPRRGSSQSWRRHDTDREYSEDDGRHGGRAVKDRRRLRHDSDDEEEDGGYRKKRSSKRRQKEDESKQVLC